MPAAHLQGSMPPRLHDCSPSPYLLEATHLQRASTAPWLHPSIPSRRSAFRDTVTRYSVRWPCKPAFRATRANPIKISRLHACSMPPELHSSTPARLQHDSTAPELLRQTPTRPLHASRAPYLYASTSARVQSSRPPYLHVCTPAAYLHSFKPHLHIHTTISRHH